MSVEVCTAEDVEPEDLSKFLGEAYGPSKENFLSDHGAWWHRGNEHRIIATVDGEIAGYSAVIPSVCQVGKTAKEAVWLVDVYVAPRFRGRGLQRQIDEVVKEIADLKLGFPNELAAKIHRKHGWSVREDLCVVMLPLHPRRVMEGREMNAAKGLALRTGATALAPLAAAWRWYLRRYRPVTARRFDDPSPEMLAAIYERQRTTEISTTQRDASFIKWRFFEAPYRDELVFFVAGPDEAPTHYLVARHVDGDKGIRTRILDLYGDFEDVETLRDILRTASQDAVRRGSIQVTAMITLPELMSTFRSLGFIAQTQTRFCWICPDPNITKELEGPGYWTLADSDNDAPG